MQGQGAGRAAAGLPWLCPNTDSLIGLAEDPAGLARLSAADPALLAFLVRYGPFRSPSAVVFTADRLWSSWLPAAAGQLLAGTRSGWLSPASGVVRRANHLGAVAAGFARRLARHTRKAPPEAAATAARLAPLGWYAVAAVDPTAAADVLADLRFETVPAETQVRHWGLDQTSVARRLAGRWRLPTWAASIVGTLGLPFPAARRLVPDADLFAVVQLAVGEAERQVPGLALAPTDRAMLLTHLGLTEDQLCELLADQHRPAGLCHQDTGSVAQAPRPVGRLDPNPHRVPLLRNLLRMAADSRRRDGADMVARLEERVDELYRSIGSESDAHAAEVRAAQLGGLAELAAGAGHEINNPLAVISTTAQRLIRTEPDPDRGDALRSVVRQTQRIHAILKELMVFARPPAAARRPVELAEVFAGVRVDLGPAAAERGVRFYLPDPADGCLIDADPAQLRQAVGAVVRNGIEAAGADGWVRVCVEATEADVRVAVEDGGPGLSDAAAAHAFVPFYCGRAAGRGRGLGLSAAWRLVRQNGGDLRLDPRPPGPTRFVLTLPRVAAEARSAA